MSATEQAVAGVWGTVTNGGKRAKPPEHLEIFGPI